MKKIPTRGYQKGPWKLVELSDEHFCQTNHKYKVETMHGWRIAYIEGLGIIPMKTASLISAAPDLFEALKECRKLVNFVRKDGSGGGEMPMNQPALEAMVDSAIKKAEGE